MIYLIFQTDYWDIIGGFFNWVSESAAIMLVLSGVMAITWLGYERKRRGSFTKRKVDIEFHVTNFLRVLSYVGLILGIFVVWSGITSLILDISPSFEYAKLNPGEDPFDGEVNYFTSIFLIVIGIAMFFFPIKDLPLASIIGLLAGTATVIVIALLVPDWAVELIGNVINPKWLLVIIFIIITVVVIIGVKFYIGIFKTISKVLSWPPIALVIMVFCFIQGFALWIFGISIVPNIF
ncbi:hypothetical protein LCGC14_1082900 [marine sediment metagenome]|uniref:Uncharacterized protein n=1 Tax=marine sediment metagenome TaxID=412755 RepID=A0A0F9QKN8_9ZZZZ